MTQAERAELVSRCEAAKDEIVVSRKLIASYKDEIAAKEDAMQRSLEKGELDEKQIDLQKQEIAALRQALADETVAYELSKKALVVYKEQLAKVTKRKNFFKTMTKVFMVTTLVTGAAAGAVILSK